MKDPKEWLMGMALTNVSSEGNGLNEVIQTKKRDYGVTSLITEGELSIIYKGYFDVGDQRKNVIIKIIKDPADNDLAMNEIRTLKALNIKDEQYLMHLSLLEDYFKTEKGCCGIIINEFEGYNLNMVREHPLYKNGVPAYHAAWMLNRILRIVGYAHTKGIIHANIEPTHLLIMPQIHNVCLIDWSYASKNDSPFKVVNKIYSAPEVAEKGIPLTSADLYSVGKCMVYLLGGNLEDNSLPQEVDIRFQRYIQNFLLTSPLQRARDAWEMLHKLTELRIEIWGEEKFVVFEW